MIEQHERISIHSISTEKPLRKKAFPLESGLELTEDAWQELLRPTERDTISSYYFRYSSLKILDFERSKALKPSKPTVKDIEIILENEEDALSLLGDISILFPGLAEPLVNKRVWSVFKYRFNKTVRNNYQDESLEKAFCIKLIDPKRVEDGFLDLGDDYFQKMSEHIRLRETRDKYYPYLRSLGFFKHIFPGRIEPAMNENEWSNLGKEISELNDSKFLLWPLRGIKLGLADTVEMTSDGLKVVVTNNHIWPKPFVSESLNLPETRKF